MGTTRPYNGCMDDYPSPRLQERDRPWMMRTYAGHSTAKASNELYRRNLAKGQTGLSVAFDLPTQTGYDPDDELARGEVGKVGVPVSHRGDMAALMQGIPLGEMNTSMTINATAAWLLALYIVAAEESGRHPPQEQLQGTTQNDIVKEFLARGTYAFPPAPSLRLIADMIAYTVEHVPKWNPINICSYHLQEAGATPIQEIAYAMSNAIAVLDAARARVPSERMGEVFGRISFFVNAGVRFVQEHAKLRAMSILWEELGRERYDVTDPKLLRFRYGVQVNSLGLTEAQPENNVQRIVLEALAVTLGRDARARAIQLPAWNEALGLPRPWDQQWSLRIQQVLAYETDILEYPDIFEGSHVMDALVAELLAGSRAEMAVVAEHGGAMQAVPYMKASLVDAHRERIQRIESGEQIVVGQNRFTETEDSPLTADAEGGILVVDPALEAQQIEAVRRWRSQRDQAAVDAALAELARVAALEGDAREGENLMVPTLAAARAGATTGEWARTLREVFGSYRAPTGVGEAASSSGDGELEELRELVAAVAERLGRRPKILVGKPGLDGHSNGAEQIAVRARDSGMDVVYEGIRLTPAQIAASARQEGVHVIGLSILSGSHRELIPAVIVALRDAGVSAPVVVGGIIPDQDVTPLKEAGVAAVYTPKDFDLTKIMRDIVELAGSGAAASQAAPEVSPQPGVSFDGAALGARLRAREVSAAPDALNLLESTAAGDREQAAALLAEVSPVRLGGEAQGHIVGITGPPGAGKSTLLSALLREWRTGGAGRTVAMLAVDPSSRRSGGSLLGDRARIDFDPADHGVFIRSTSAGEQLGGLASGTRAAAQALAAAFDVVVIETVGVGQAETDVADVADTVLVVVQPGSGDVLQFLKSGIMEIPDVLVVTKADLGQVAVRTRRDLTAALRSLGSRATPVIAVSSLPPPHGVQELIAALEEHRSGLDIPAQRVHARRAGALADYAREHGEHGLSALGGRRAAESLLAELDPAADIPSLVRTLERRADG